MFDAEKVFPADDLARDDVSWFLATSRGKPVGVVRVLYDPPLDEYLKYNLQFTVSDVDLLAMIREKRIAEVGRFAVLPSKRNAIAIVTSLMRAATRDIVSKGYTQLVTDVFENDPTSPLKFHTNVIGFQKIATHEVGELRHKGRRVTLMLDLKESYRKLKARGNWFFRAMTLGWTETMHRRVAA